MVNETMPGTFTPPNESVFTSSRITQNGRTITYKLEVIQQPERARACGAGAKSSADRRPVDPPPVVELRIYQTEPGTDVQRDITFAYNANFFLFATLDTARPIAQARGAAQPASFPVLTGVPVAGIAYLDRPSQAGYFIFPDLSVRHEGQYRLNFALYEELKEKDDADKGAPPLQFAKRQVGTPLKPIAPDTFLNFRLEVKSKAFTVYSAKKFPGLTTSTHLSRVVAEQGCRVRIRRDVRMRRRGEKGGKDYADYDDERPFGGSPRYTTPDGYGPPVIERPRSTSNSTVVDTPFVPGPDGHRRPSATEYGYGPLPPRQPYHQSPAPATGISAPPAPPPANGSDGQSHLCFGTSHPQYPAPQLPSVHQSTQAIPYPSSLPHTRNPSNASDRDTNAQQYPSQSPSRAAAEKTTFSRPALPPLIMDGKAPDRPAFENSFGGTRPPLTDGPLPSLAELMRDRSETMESSNTFRRPRHYETESHLATKRSHGETFGDQREGPLFNGNRPDSYAYDPVHQSKRDSTGAVFSHRSEGPMEYRRADGSYTTKFRQEA